MAEKTSESQPSEPEKAEEKAEEKEESELGDATEGKANGAKGKADAGVGSVDGTSAGSGAESLEDTFDSNASKEYTFGSSHSQPSRPKLPPLGPGTAVKKLPVPVRSPKGQSPSPKGSARRHKAGGEDSEDEGGCEFTFGTSVPIQLPDFSQQKSIDEGSLRQAGVEEKPSTALAPVQEAPERPPNERPLPPRSPPPAIHRPPSGAAPPWVSPRTRGSSPRTASPRPQNWHPHMPQLPQQLPQQPVYGQMPLQQQMYAYNAAAQQAVAQQAMVAQQAAAQQAVAQQAVAQHVAQMAAQQALAAEVHSPYEVAGVYSSGQAEDQEPEVEHVEQEEAERIDAPLSIKCAYWIESACTEASACKACQVRVLLGCTCVLLFIAGAIVTISLVPSGVES